MLKLGRRKAISIILILFGFGAGVWLFNRSNNRPRVGEVGLEFPEKLESSYKGGTSHFTIRLSRGVTNRVGLSYLQYPQEVLRGMGLYILGYAMWSSGFSDQLVVEEPRLMKFRSIEFDPTTRSPMVQNFSRAADEALATGPISLKLQNGVKNISGKISGVEINLVSNEEYKLVLNQLINQKKNFIESPPGLSKGDKQKMLGYIEGETLVTYTYDISESYGKSDEGEEHGIALQNNDPDRDGSLLLEDINKALSFVPMSIDSLVVGGGNPIDGFLPIYHLSVIMGCGSGHDPCHHVVDEYLGEYKKCLERTCCQ